MLSCVNLLDLYAYYTLVRVLSWLYFNTIYCVYIIKLIIYSYPLIQTFCTAPAVPLLGFLSYCFKRNKNFGYVNEFSCLDLTECLKFLIVSISGGMWVKVSSLPLFNFNFSLGHLCSAAHMN